MKEQSKEELVKIVQKENEKKLEDFNKEYKELCDKYGFDIVPKIQLQIVPKKAN